MKKSLHLNAKNFESFFTENYTPLCRYCIRYVRDPYIAEEIVQELFIHLWEKRSEITLHRSYKAYLKVSVRNRSLNYLNRIFSNKIFDDNIDQADHSSVHTPLQIVEGDELDKILKKGFESLPEKCYTVFCMKKFARLTHREIAQELSISEKTVENHITAAIKKLRVFVERHYSHLPVFLFMLFDKFL